MGQDIVGSKMPTFASEQTQTSTCRPHALRLLSPRGDLARALVEQQALWKVRALSPLMPANAVREGARPCAKVGVEGSNPFARSSDFFNEINWMRRISGHE